MRRLTWGAMVNKSQPFRTGIAAVAALALAAGGCASSDTVQPLKRISGPDFAAALRKGVLVRGRAVEKTGE